MNHQLIQSFVLGWLVGTQGKEAVSLVDCVTLTSTIIQLGGLQTKISIPDTGESYIDQVEHFFPKKPIQEIEE